MKINNEYVEVKHGNKIHRKQNMILNSYLRVIFQSLLDSLHDNSEITTCYIKLDEPIENVDYDTEINVTTEFDIKLFNGSKNLIKNDNNVKVIYNFTTETFAYRVGESQWIGATEQNFSMFVGRKITGIGFGSSEECFTYLDTTAMNVVINEEEEFKFTRVDNFLTDGIVKGVSFPLHLINDIAKYRGKWIELPTQTSWYSTFVTTMGELYSIGFGNTQGIMEEEYLIDDVEIGRDDNSITFNTTRNKSIGHYPSENLQLGFYPLKDNSKYLIVKYRLYEKYLDNDTQPVITYLDEYYTSNMKNENFGNLNIKLKIERL